MDPRRWWKIMEKVEKMEKVENIKKAYGRKLITGREYVKNMDNVNGWKNEEERKEAEVLRKQAEALIYFNGENIQEAFREVLEEGAENHEEALRMIIEGNLLYDSIPGRYNRRKMLDLYGYEYALKIIEEEFGAEVWTHVSPTDLGALIDLATEAEARTYARFFYDLAQS